MQDQVNRLTAIRPIQTHVFRANAIDGRKPAGRPAGRGDRPGYFPTFLTASTLNGSKTQSSQPAWALLEALFEFLTPKSIVAIASDKLQKAAHEKYERLERFPNSANGMWSILKPA